jgi:hypothetical protein
MMPRIGLRLEFLALTLISLAAAPSWSQEAAAIGLKGAVHTVLTANFHDEAEVPNQPGDSTYEIYDRAGYQLEIFRYKPDGSVWVHTIITRKREQIVRSQTIGTAPFKSYSVENVFDTKGRVIETDEYDGDKILKNKTTWRFDDRISTSTTHWTETKGDGGEKTGDVIETTDLQTGVTHQVSTTDGELKSDWVIQRERGRPPSDKIIFPDGSYNEREQQSDGSTVEDRGQGSTNTHTYQKTDSQGHVIEVIQGSGANYIRCTYSYDENGRPTGQINYDALGKIVDKTTTEYVDDSFGNWIEQKIFTWDTNNELPTQKPGGTNFRTINYY